MDNMTVRNALAASLSEARADSSISRRIERGWYALDSAGTQVFRLSPGDPADTPCANANVPTVPYPGTPTVGGHIHPFSIGDTLPDACKDKRTRRSTVLYDWGYGGLSGADWQRAGNEGLPHIVMDKDSIYVAKPHPMHLEKRPDGRLVPVPDSGWQAKTKSYARRAASCSRP